MGCVSASGVVEKSIAGVVEVYACQLLNCKSDLKGGEN